MLHTVDDLRSLVSGRCRHHAQHVGFTLKGKTVEEQLGALAESTGGRYYGAQSGEELVAAGQDTVLTVVLKGEQFVIER